jgi:hypothetical protein
MIARNPNPSVPRSNAAGWRRWEPDTIEVFADIATIRWPAANDLCGRPLPPVPQLSTILSGLSCYHRLHFSCRALGDAVRAMVLKEIAESVRDAVADLRRYGLDLLWRIEGPDPDEGGSASPANSLTAALAIDRLP